ncbi:hypothetical protein OHT76_22520 [Streptomyces sp. NBC_00287]|uniref:hypothetical protein n=1 Tax=Streptomyces sp. NBC_00287 TaxID=2975702 RepID=UPI002E2B88B2|nr:hypothetical protein [Streptomyces sp. NBC_00287]
MTEIHTSPLVLHGRRRSVARLRAGVLLLEAGGVRHRIPVAAIERVEVSGAKGRVLTVVLSSATHTLTSRSAPAVREFAEAVRRALPVRDADEPRPAVSAEPVERPGVEPGYVVLWALGVAFVLVAVALVVRGAGEQAVVFWLVGPVVLGCGGAALAGGLTTVREAAVLRTRGITVEGRLTLSYEMGTGEDAVTHYEYTYVDARGQTRTRSGPAGGAEEVEIVYDPEDPEGTTKVGRGTAGVLALGVFYLVIGVPATLGGLWMVGTGAVALF